METRTRILQTLRRQSRGRLVVIACVFAVALLSAFDHLGAFGYSGDDWTRFDQKSFRVARCIDGDTIVIDGETIVNLLGVDAPELPDAHWAENASKYTTARTVGRDVTLRLEPIQPRNERGHLLAYVFITDADNLNADLVRDGQAYADRRVKHTFAPLLQSAETEARKKPRGLWVDLSESQMPRWRREWLRSIQK